MRPLRSRAGWQVSNWRACNGGSAEGSQHRLARRLRPLPEEDPGWVRPVRKAMPTCQARRFQTTEKQCDPIDSTYVRLGVPLAYVRHLDDGQETRPDEPGPTTELLQQHFRLKTRESAPNPLEMTKLSPRRGFPISRPEPCRRPEFFVPGLPNLIGETDRIGHHTPSASCTNKKHRRSVVECLAFRLFAIN